MNYLLLGNETKRLFIEDDKQCYSVWFDKKEKKWIKGKTELFDARVGYDPYEPEDSIYKYGAGEYLLDIIQITKEEAEAFISECIDEDDIAYLIHEKSSN